MKGKNEKKNTFVAENACGSHFFCNLQHYPSFIFNKSTKLIKFKILWSLFEHSKHF